jgi:hypothetical protein
MDRARLVVVAAALTSVIGCAHDTAAGGPEAHRGDRRSPAPAVKRVSSPPAAEHAALVSAVSGEEARPTAVMVTPADDHDSSRARSRPEGPPPWMKALRVCGSADRAAAKKHPLGADPVELGKIVAVEGRLAPGAPDCTMMKCNFCCNGCTFEWVIVPRNDCADRHFRVRTVERLPLQGSASECDIGRMGAHAVKVLAIGRMAGTNDLIADADLCRTGPADDRSDQLDEADYARLLSTSRGSSVDVRRCRSRAPLPQAPAASPRPSRPAGFGDLL